MKGKALLLIMDDSSIGRRRRFIDIFIFIPEDGRSSQEDLFEAGLKLPSIKGMSSSRMRFRR